MNRKTATRLLLVQWSRFQNVCMDLEGSTLFTGVNGSGKSTVLDAMTYLLTGNTQFNKAAKDRDRTVLAYVRGDTKSNGAARYLRDGEIVSYIAMEFDSPTDNTRFVAGVCIESANEAAQKSSWFLCRDATIGQINFTKKDKEFLKITPKGELAADGRRLKPSDFLGRERGVEQVLRALGLRCDAATYRSKLLKMMAFRPENNIGQFIQECVLEAGKVESLKELREQRRRFEQIRELFQNLQKSKQALETVEKKSGDYERARREFDLRSLMACYQQLCGKQEEERRIQLRIEALIQKKENLKREKQELDEQCQAAGERYRIAENQTTFCGMQDSLNVMMRRREELEDKALKAKEKLKRLQGLQAQLVDLLTWLDDGARLDENQKHCLCSLADASVAVGDKTNVFLRCAALAEQKSRSLEEDEVHCRDRMAKQNEEAAQLEDTVKQLMANRMVFPKEVETAKQVLQKELDKAGIRTEVRFFAELVQNVRDAKWRAAMETFLGRRRFFLIIDEKYTKQTMEIIERKKLYALHLVMADQLPDAPIAAGSAAEALVIPNPAARKYANYLLNGIRLCSDLEELRRYPKGGLMQNGMLAKSYAISRMDIRKTEFCLGEEAIQLKLQQAFAQKEKQADALKLCRESLSQIAAKRKALSQVDWNISHYDFQAASALEDFAAKSAKIAGDIEKIRDNPDFMAVLQEQKDAKQEYESVREALDCMNRQIGACEKDEENQKNCLKSIAAELFTLKQAYEQKCMEHLELQVPMLEEYEKRRAKKGDWQALAPKAIHNAKRDFEECVKQLENAQLEYCRLAEMDIHKRGPAYIPFFREEFRKVANIKMEEVHCRLKEQAEKLESAFMNDFVAELNETIQEAKGEIDAVNRELRRIPFGNDTYRFVMREKPDRAVFFRICRKLEHYMNSPEVYMNFARDDEEMERDIRDFMEIILDEEDETEYTDYRKYFLYDMEILSRQGGSEITADLSKKQGSASNGEKQTPYFIILAASLLQCYPKDVCCARLAFIDEAFSALSRERIEQMVRYFEENGFQVFYAAPPEKISSIGAYIQSTVSLVITGRYTHAIEGLVREY